MASASIYIQSRAYKDGTVPVFLRLIIDRKVHLKQLCKVTAGNIDRKKMEVRKAEPGYIQINLLISRSLQEAKEYLTDCQIRKINPDAEVFFGGRDKGNTIVSHILARAEQMHAAGQYRTAQKYRATGRKIERLKVDAVITDITVGWIRKLDAALIVNGNNPNTRGKDMAVVSAVINLVEGLPNPFSRYRKPGNKTSKAKLSMDEIERMETVELDGIEDLARDIFIFAVHARGMRAFDVMTLRWDNVKDGRLRYVASKTGKVIDMAISNGMLLLLAKYVSLSPYNYIFPVMNWPYDRLAIDRRRFLNRVNSICYDINASLRLVAVNAKIDKHITLHVARHTFAYLADQGGIPLGTIQQLLDHGKIGTTQAYVESLRRTDELDNAVENLF